MTDFMDALSMVPAVDPLPVQPPSDPEDILFNQWIPYSIPKLIDATLEDFPEKKQVLRFNILCFAHCSKIST
jgi:hypothetical protein